MYVWIHSEQEDEVVPFVHRIEVRKDDGPWCIVIETTVDGSLSVAVNHTVIVKKDTE